MADVKQILVVDDHFEMLEFLRSMLELSNHDYQVLGVPSAEEGFLELRRTPFDLLITDLRLPGMSGFDLVRKVQRFRPDIPIIMITGYSSEQGRKEAAELGIFRYFQKPLDTDGLLATVHAALYGTDVAVAVETAVEAPPEISPDIAKRLEALRSDTGARLIMLGDAKGQLLYETGDSGKLDLAQLGVTIATNMNSSFLLAEQLGSQEPFTIQYQAGQRFDLYSANVGRHLFVAIFFGAESRRGRIGTIWVFAQRAIKDLLSLLPSLSSPASNGKESATAVAPPTIASQPKTVPLQPQPKPKPEPKAKPVAKAPEDPPPNLIPEVQYEKPVELTSEVAAELAAELAALAANKPVPSSIMEEGDLDLDAFWDAAIDDSHTSADGAGLVSIHEIQAQGLVDFEFELKPPAPEAPADAAKTDLDSFWDEALLSETESGDTDGFSWEEARKKGLIPSEFTKDE